VHSYYDVSTGVGAEPGIFDPGGQLSSQIELLGSLTQVATFRRSPRPQKIVERRTPISVESAFGSPASHKLIFVP